ncbi:MAG TPA: glycosyltransferase [Thermoanaerobaculia bacterium]|nr:glycosyltransferase [Thermoanaerobaculia bacterium]
MGRLEAENVITVAIPTFERGRVLVRTIDRLLALDPRPGIIVADQTPLHPGEVETRLREWESHHLIRRLRLPAPSIPMAMNQALLAAATPLVLFLDDDVEFDDSLLPAHIAAHGREDVWAVAGQVLERGEHPQHHAQEADPLRFRFNHDTGCFVTNVMAGNLSVKRDRALRIGGFDEHFVGAAYRFETDFALRLTGAGGRIWFEPAASIRHLKVEEGGIRSHGDHRTTASPAHAVGDYYFAIRHGRPFAAYAIRRVIANVLTRYHLRHPWAIPAKLLAEWRGIALAKRLARKPPKLIGGNSSATSDFPPAEAP